MELEARARAFTSLLELELDEAECRLDYIAPRLESFGRVEGGGDDDEDCELKYGYDEVVVLRGKLEVIKDVYEEEDEVCYMGEVIHVYFSVFGYLVDYKAKTGGYLFVLAYLLEDIGDHLLVLVGNEGPAGAKDGKGLALDALGDLVRETTKYLKKGVIYVDNLLGSYGGGRRACVPLGYDSLELVGLGVLYRLKKHKGRR